MLLVPEEGRFERQEEEEEEEADIEGVHQGARGDHRFLISIFFVKKKKKSSKEQKIPTFLYIYV